MWLWLFKWKSYKLQYSISYYLCVILTYKSTKLSLFSVEHKIVKVVKCVYDYNILFFFCFSKIQNSLTFSYQLTQLSWKLAIKQVQCRSRFFCYRPGMMRSCVIT